MFESLNGQLFEHNVLSLHFKSFSKECVTIKEVYGRNLLNQETKLKSVSLLLNLCPSNRLPLPYKSCYFNTFK